MYFPIDSFCLQQECLEVSINNVYVCIDTITGKPL